MPEHQEVLSAEVAERSPRSALKNLIDPKPPEVAGTVPDPAPLDRPGPNDNNIGKMTGKDAVQVAQSLAEAFYTDPHMSYIIGDDGKRLNRLGHGILAFLEREWMPRGEVYTHDKLIGAAAWMPPDTWHSSMISQLGLLRSMVGVSSPGDIGRLIKVSGFVEGKHKEIQRERGSHWYLPMLGVTPEWQGRGWGDALLRPVLERCDEQGIPAYLEASTARNVPLYRRNGFRVIGMDSYADGPEPLRFMWREPKNH